MMACLCLHVCVSYLNALIWLFLPLRHLATHVHDVDHLCSLAVFAMLIDYCHILVKFGHDVPLLPLFLTCVLSCCVSMCVRVRVCLCVRVCVRVFSVGRFCSRARKRGRRIWYAGLTSFCLRHKSALSFLSLHFFQPIHTHLL